MGLVALLLQKISKAADKKAIRTITNRPVYSSRSTGVEQNRLSLFSLNTACGRGPVHLATVLCEFMCLHVHSKQVFSLSIQHQHIQHLIR